MLRELSYARVRESRLQDERLALDPRRAIFGLAALPLLHLLFDFVGGWVDRRSVNVHAHTAKQIERKITQNLRASTRARFELNSNNCANKTQMCFTKNIVQYYKYA